MLSLYICAEIWPYNKLLAETAALRDIATRTVQGYIETAEIPATAVRDKTGHLFFF